MSSAKEPSYLAPRLERSVKPLMTELSAPEEDAYAGDEVQVAAARVQAAWKPKFGLTLS